MGTRRILASVSLLSAILLASTSSAAFAAKITAAYPAWSPSSASIASGESVEFESADTGLAHGVEWKTGPALPSCTTGVASPGAKVGPWSGSCTFSQAGTYDFVCSLHPTSMKGTILVSGPEAPSASTGEGKATSDTAASLAGTVNPKGLSTKYFFKYGTSVSYGALTPEVSAGAGTEPVAAAATLSGLAPSTTYHFQLVATNSAGTRNGGDRTFTTSGPPSVTTGNVTGLSTTGMTLLGTVNPFGHPTTYYFEWGTDTSYGNLTEEASVPASGSTSVSAPLTGLQPGTTYHYRLVAENDSGPAVPGADKAIVTKTESSGEPEPPPGTGSGGAPQPPPTVEPPPAPSAPETTISGKVAAKTRDRTPTIKFSSSTAGTSFECKVDGKAFKTCRSPFTTKTLAFGKHKVQVRAVLGGVSDPTPVSVSFKVLRRKS